MIPFMTNDDCRTMPAICLFGAASLLGARGALRDPVVDRVATGVLRRKGARPGLETHAPLFGMVELDDSAHRRVADLTTPRELGVRRGERYGNFVRLFETVREDTGRQTFIGTKDCGTRREACATRTSVLGGGGVAQGHLHLVGTGDDEVANESVKNICGNSTMALDHALLPSCFERGAS